MNSGGWPATGACPGRARLAIADPANHIFVKWQCRLSDIVDALAALGRSRRLDDGRWMG